MDKLSGLQAEAKEDLIILDNAGSHHNNLVKEAILKSGNKYLFSVPRPFCISSTVLFLNQF